MSSSNLERGVGWGGADPGKDYLDALIVITFSHAYLLVQLANIYSSFKTEH